MIVHTWPCEVPGLDSDRCPLATDPRHRSHPAVQAETRTPQRLGSVPGDEQGGSFGDFIGGDLPKKLALLVVGAGQLLPGWRCIVPTPHLPPGMAVQEPLPASLSACPAASANDDLLFLRTLRRRATSLPAHLQAAPEPVSHQPTASPWACPEHPRRA